MSQTAGASTIGGTGSYVYEDSRGCTSFMVGVKTGSPVGALVNIPGLHDDGEFFSVPVGEHFEFRLNNGGIRKVFIKGDAGNANVIFGVVSKT